MTAEHPYHQPRGISLFFLLNLSPCNMLYVVLGYAVLRPHEKSGTVRACALHFFFFTMQQKQ